MYRPAQTYRVSLGFPRIPSHTVPIRQILTGLCFVRYVLWLCWSLQCKSYCMGRKIVAITIVIILFNFQEKKNIKTVQNKTDGLLT